MSSSPTATDVEGGVPQKTSLLALGIAALGVVYGDIGTSPLYAIKQTFFGAHPLARNLENVLGVLSLVFWTLLLIVCLKYVLLVLRADFHGEGGIFALLGIIREQNTRKARSKRFMWLVTTAVMIGAATLYGDGIITPAISVLSAYEGLEVITAAFKPAVIWLTVITLLLLFLFQSRGTERVGRIFGPIMIVWFITIGAAGLVWIIAHPAKMAPPKPGAALPPPGPYDIASSAHWANKPALGITVHTPQDQTEIHIWKARYSRFGRKGGKATIGFDELTGRYFDLPSTGSPDTSAPDLFGGMD